MILIYHKQVAEYKEEIEELSIKEKNIKIDIKDILKKIDIKELKSMRNEHKLKALIKQGRKSESKLDKIKIRLKNLNGDCIILACSVVYLGTLSV